MNEPVNAVGATEQQWNTWKAAQQEWEDLHPFPVHTSSQVCDCGEKRGMPGRPWRQGKAGHCAVRGPICEWGPAV